MSGAAYQRLAIHDPRRSPPEYTGHVAPHQFIVFLSDVATAAELTPDGAPPPAGQSPSCYVFDSLDAAVTFSKDLVQHHPRVRCQVLSHRGRSTPPLQTIVHPSHQKHLPSRRKVWVMCLVAAGLILCAPPLFYWDAQLKFPLVFPTFLALNCIIIAARILFWAHGVHERVREEELARAPLKK
jgi:hypothetical protein